MRAHLRQFVAMKVTRNTRDILIVEDRPLLITLVLGFFFFASIAGILAGLAGGELFVAVFFGFFAAFLSIFIFVFVRRVQLIFDRPNDTLTFRNRSLKNYEQVVRDLSGLSHAITEGGETKRSVLVFDKGMSEGHHPVTAYATSGPAPKRITDAINAWLKDAAAVDSKGSNT
jgi:hypothetical protein